jgi:hypothetical protein
MYPSGCLPLGSSRAMSRGQQDRGSGLKVCTLAVLRHDDVASALTLNRASKSFKGTNNLRA